MAGRKGRRERPKEGRKAKLMSSTLSLPFLQQHIVITNLSHGFTRPCILDIKLGTVLYDTKTVTEDKKARMEKTARETTSLETGVRLTGFQVRFSRSLPCLAFKAEVSLSRCIRTGTPPPPPSSPPPNPTANPSPPPTSPPESPSSSLSHQQVSPPISSSKS